MCHGGVIDPSAANQDEDRASVLLHAKVVSGGRRDLESIARQFGHGHSRKNRIVPRLDHREGVLVNEMNDFLHMTPSFKKLIEPNRN